MICRVCTLPMAPDALVAADARRFLDPGMPVPVVMRCDNGHGVRLHAADDEDTPPPATVRTTPRCAVCGVEIPRRRGAAPRKSCGPEHRGFIERKRAEAQTAHVRLHKAWQPDAPFVPFRFIVEAQPWYRGAATAFQPPAPAAEPVIPSEPGFPEIPADWLAGFLRLYPTLESGALLPSIFPPLDAMPYPVRET